MRKIILIFSAFLLILASCKGRKTRAGAISKTVLDSTKMILPEIKNVIKSSFEFDYLSYKAKCDYKDQNMDQGFTMNLRMKRDSILWISINAVGFEVARAKLDKDSVRIINRLDKKYYGYDYAFIKKLSGTLLTLGQIQALLTANLLYSPETYSPASDVSKYKTVDGYIENTLTVDGKSNIIEQILQHLVEPSKATIIYSDYKKTEKQLFPGKVDMAVVTAKRTMSLIMENSGINTSAIDAFPFEIPGKYEKGN